MNLYLFKISFYSDIKEEELPATGFTFAKSYSEAVKNIETMYNDIIAGIDYVKELEAHSLSAPIFETSETILEAIQNEDSLW